MSSVGPNANMTTLLGCFVIAASLLVAFWWMKRELPNKGWAMSITLMGIFVGIFFLLQDRATEISIQGVGTIKAAAEKASADVEAIAALRQRIEAQSATVDLVARQATDAKEMADKLGEKTATAEKKLTGIDEALTTARGKVDELEQISRFTRTVLAAQNDDRRAFDQLNVWARDSAFKFRTEASAAWSTILNEHAKSFYMSGFTVPWREGIDPGKLTIAELKAQYSNAPVYLRPALIEYVWKRDDISKVQRMSFLADVVRQDASLQAVEYAGRLLSNALEARLKPLATEELLQVWEKKKGQN